MSDLLDMTLDSPQLISLLLTRTCLELLSPLCKITVPSKSIIFMNSITYVCHSHLKYQSSLLLFLLRASQISKETDSNSLQKIRSGFKAMATYICGGYHWLSIYNKEKWQIIKKSYTRTMGICITVTQCHAAIVWSRTQFMSIPH